MNIIDRLTYLKSLYKADLQHDRAQGLQYAVDEVTNQGVEVFSVLYTFRNSIETFLFLKPTDAEQKRDELIEKFEHLAIGNPARYDYYDGELTHIKTGALARKVVLSKNIVK